MSPSWPSVLRSRPADVIVTLAVLVASVWSYARFLTMVEARQGAVLTDPVHALFAPVDATWPIFLALYGALAATLVVLGRRPLDLLAAARAYSILVAMRMLMMWVTPLDPPPTMLPLTDPFVAMFTAGGATMTRDLFFSGHTSLLCLLAFMMPVARLRATFVGLAVFVGCAVIAQHVHYTVDVLVAPLAAWAAASLAGRPAGR